MPTLECWLSCDSERPAQILDWTSPRGGVSPSMISVTRGLRICDPFVVRSLSMYSVSLCDVCVPPRDRKLFSHCISPVIVAVMMLRWTSACIKENEMTTTLNVSWDATHGPRYTRCRIARGMILLTWTISPKSRSYDSATHIATLKAKTKTIGSLNLWVICRFHTIQSEFANIASSKSTSKVAMTDQAFS